MKPLFLASASPRRRELLEKAHVSFQVFSVKVSEFPQENLTVDEQILQIARQKAEATAQSLVKQGLKSFLVLAADTEVIVQQRLSGKPQNPEHAFSMLKNLSGQSHQVKTAVVLLSHPEKQELTHIETTTVIFRDLSDKEIWDYVHTGEPMDKAGAYGIQGLGGKLVKEFHGSFENVVGLPVKNVLEMISNANARANTNVKY